MPRRPRVTAAELIRALERGGFVHARTHGSHRLLKSLDGRKRVTVPYHASRVVPPGTVANILREAGISDEQLMDLLKG